MFVVSLYFILVDTKISLRIVTSLCDMAEKNTIKLDNVLWAKKEVLLCIHGNRYLFIYLLF